MAKTKVLLTGGDGRIGSHVVPKLQEWFDLRNFSIRPVETDPDTIIGDIQDYDALKKAMDGVEAVIHLAATSDEAPFIEELVPNNVIGLYNTFRACVECGVRRLIFASTCQTVMSYPADHTVELADPVRPVSHYGCTKVLGEVMGRYYHDHKGLEFIAIRIGWFQSYDSDRLKKGGGARSLWLSPKDAANLFRCAVEKPDVGFAIVFGTSITEKEWLSRTPAREVLGFEPEDDVVRLYPINKEPEARVPGTENWNL